MATNAPIPLQMQPPVQGGAPPVAGTQAPGLAFKETPKPLIDIPNGWLWFFGILAALIVAAVAYLLLRYWRKRRAIIKLPPPIPPHVRARRALEQALALISQPEAFSVAVSRAIRVYLEERFQFHAPDRTTEEFLYELRDTQLLTQDQKKSLGGFLESCDLIKFAKYEPTEVELRGLHGAALRLVNETEPREVPAEIGSSAPPNNGSAPPPVLVADRPPDVRMEGAGSLASPEPISREPSEIR